jgi:hypothetical protein
MKQFVLREVERHFVGSVAALLKDPHVILSENPSRPLHPSDCEFLPGQRLVEFDCLPRWMKLIIADPAKGWAQEAGRSLGRSH